MDKQLRISPRYHRWHVDPGVEWVEANTACAHLDWSLPLAQAALVLVDVWDAHYLHDTAARAEKIIQGTLKPLLASCRQAGLEIIHAPSPPQAHEHPNWLGAGRPAETPGPASEWPPPDFRSKSGAWSQYDKPKEARQGEIEAMRARRIIHPVAEPAGDEVVIATGDELHEHCSRREILFLLYAGFNTNACILLRDYGTVEMSKRGYEVVLLRDCTTGMESAETHHDLWQTRGAVLFLEMFGRYSLTSQELVDGLPD